jgi:hypothetical protein
MITLALKLLPPEEAIAYFRQKGYRIGFSYLDVWQQEHQAAFTVAKAMSLDLLTDIRAEVDAALAKGTTLQTFIDALRPNLVQRGWWGKQEVIDPKTGEKVLAQLGSPRRLKVIYDTNLRTAHAEGQWQRIQSVKATLPYLLYDHVPSAHERPEHVAWDGLVLPVDDPWWLRHMPVKAWGCKCRVIQLGERQLKRLGKGVDSAPEETWRDYTNQRSGETQRVPAGVDPAFNYPPLARKQALEKTLAEKQAHAAEVLRPGVADDQRQFVKAKTAKAAAEWAVQNNLADFADFTGVDPDVANAWNQSLFEHFQEFPELRKNQKFIGTCQAQFARFRKIEIQRVLDKLVLVSPGTDLSVLRGWAEKAVKRMVVTGNRYAHSWAQADVSGVAVNQKWGADVAKFNASLADSAALRWHPVGCDTIRSVVDHELGHQLDDLLKLRIDPELNIVYNRTLKAGIREEVSGYAGKNIEEFIAECWAESCNNPSPRGAARTVAAIIRQRYRARYP